MRTIVTLAAFGLAACSFSGGSAPSVTDGQSGDGTHVIPDGQPDAINVVTADARTCFGEGAFSICLTAAELTPTAVELTGDLDTGVGTSTVVCQATQPSDWTAAGQPPACFMIASTIAITTGTLRVFGTRPLVLLATDTLTISETIDASSHVGEIVNGPGANPSACPGSGASAAGQNNGRGGGGAGGSFIDVGANGGTSNNGDPTAGVAGAHVSTPALLRGGCNGADGGSNDGATGGSGGGAVYLVAGNAIALQGNISINVSGGGSAHGGMDSGGGGGGSGGMLVIYAPSITGPSAILIANGGGGSSGGADGVNGNDGSDPDATNPNTQAPGGSGAGTGGAGGLGDAGGTLAQQGANANTNKGGGGGGGGAGYLRANVTITGVTASPVVDVVP